MLFCPQYMFWYFCQKIYQFMDSYLGSWFSSFMSVLCQQHVAFTIMALYCNFKSDMVMPSEVFLFIRISGSSGLLHKI